MANNRLIVVTGAASGIGAAAAQLLKESGDTVVGVDIKEPASGDVDQFVAMDQSDSASIDAAISELPNDIDGLINSAGVPPSGRFPGFALKYSG